MVFRQRKRKWDCKTNCEVVGAIWSYLDQVDLNLVSFVYYLLNSFKLLVSFPAAPSSSRWNYCDYCVKKQQYVDSFSE